MVQDVGAPLEKMTCKKDKNYFILKKTLRNWKFQSYTAFSKCKKIPLRSGIVEMASEIARVNRETWVRITFLRGRIIILAESGTECEGNIFTELFLTSSGIQVMWNQHVRAVSSSMLSYWCSKVQFGSVPSDNLWKRLKVPKDLYISYIK